MKLGICLFAMYTLSEPKTDIMIKVILNRLRNTCFGMSCIQGECFPACISVLRLLSALHSEKWIDTLLYPLGEAFMSLGKTERFQKVTLI